MMMKETETLIKALNVVLKEKTENQRCVNSMSHEQFNSVTDKVTLALEKAVVQEKFIQVIKKQLVLLHSKGETTTEVVKDNGGPDNVGIDYGTIFFLIAGCAVLLVFLSQEYSVAKQKRSGDSKITFTWGEIVGYRLDFHFSTNQMAKPVMLCAVSFILILLSTVGFVIATGEELGASFWRAWTYGKVLGGCDCL